MIARIFQGLVGSRRLIDVTALEGMMKVSASRWRFALKGSVIFLACHEGSRSSKARRSETRLTS